MPSALLFCWLPALGLGAAMYAAVWRARRRDARWARFLLSGTVAASAAPGLFLLLHGVLTQSQGWAALWGDGALLLLCSWWAKVALTATSTSQTRRPAPRLPGPSFKTTHRQTEPRAPAASAQAAPLPLSPAPPAESAKSAETAASAESNLPLIGFWAVFLALWAGVYWLTGFSPEGQAPLDFSLRLALSFGLAALIGMACALLALFLLSLVFTSLALLMAWNL